MLTDLQVGTQLGTAIEMFGQIAEIVCQVAEGHVILCAMVVGWSDEDELAEMREMIDCELKEDLFEVSVGFAACLCVDEYECIRLFWSRLDNTVTCG